MSLSSFLVFSLFGIVASYGARNPVVLVPGLGGCQMEVKVDLERTSNFLCYRKTKDFFLLWANPKYFLPYYLECLLDIMHLNREPLSGRTFSPPGVSLRFPGWGSTATTEFISGFQTKHLSYFYNLVDALVKQRGYERGKNIRGAPYDFRKVANELGPYFSALKQLIESSYFDNGQLRVVLVCHSQGCLVTQHFLHNQPQAWKDKFIKSLVSVGAPYGGAAMAVKAFAIGDDLKIPTIKSIWVRRTQRTWPTVANLVPKLVSWALNEPLVFTDKKNYSLSNIRSFFKDIRYPKGYDFYASMKNLTDVRKGPGVRVHCIVTRSTPTGKIYDWRGKNLLKDNPKIIWGEGDGTVNWQSLLLCPKFAATQRQPVFTHLIEGVDHLTILRDQFFVDYVLNSVL